MKTILAAVDLHHHAEEVLARAAQLSVRHETAVVIQHVVEDMEVGEPRVRDAIEQHARASLETLVGAAGFPATPSLMVECGVPHRHVTAAAHEIPADLILIGPGQPSTAMQRVFGSTADRIVRTAPVPVLVVRSKSARQYSSVAVAIDFSPLSEAALDAARTLATDTDIELVHVYDVPFPFEQAMLRAGTPPDEAERFRQAKVNECRRQLVALARKHASSAGASVLRGAPGAALVELSRSGHVDLIALGTQGRGAVPSLLGSVARRLLLESGCDVLVVGLDLKQTEPFARKRGAVSIHSVPGLE